MIKERIIKATSPVAVRIDNFNKKISSNNIMFRTFLASLFFISSLGIFTTVLRRGEDALKLIVVIYGFVLLLFFLNNISVFIINVTRSAINKSPNFPAILLFNTFFGFISQLFFFNLTLAIIIRTLAYMSRTNTLVCEFKCSIVSFYYNTQLYAQINNLIWWIILGSIAAFVAGNYLVWLRNYKPVAKR